MSVELGSELDGEVAIVTGASSGIGEATAEALAARGASVVLAARRETELEALADRIEAQEGDALVVPTDVTEEEDIDALVEATLDEYGAIDILVNNAGVMLLEPVERADRENFRQMVEVNLLGLMNLTHAALPTMQEQGSGHIVNVSSTAGRRANANSSGYNATKFGVNAFTEALRQEVTTDGVRTTIIEPGAVDTELQEHIPDEKIKQRVEEGLLESMQPLESEDIARAITYAVSQPQHVNVNEMLIRPTDQQR
ncbi:SDR family NAD(P)-dependent oxidoreductase [Halovenus sp. WSH3]|uniref:SDR family NAD(P)-dependent oxidoreductase n=1 Tax=Halovenus carboxidivorans TaxID=2692199 RepID=A0A6B0SWV7_9EURY|nr:SDR family NAD(P)-dependent oxidoreductase [Halovenus carboxidivorans]MXR50178.1 SDR family NAD(P)-dependent oxidoreductase [Halovenus carboxidivorans]